MRIEVERYASSWDMNLKASSMKIAFHGLSALMLASMVGHAASTATVSPSEQPLLRDIAAAPDAAQLQACLLYTSPSPRDTR